jgi:hypothetical protein
VSIQLFVAQKEERKAEFRGEPMPEFPIPMFALKQNRLTGVFFRRHPPSGKALNEQAVDDEIAPAKKERTAGEILLRVTWRCV